MRLNRFRQFIAWGLMGVLMTVAAASRPDREARGDAAMEKGDFKRAVKEYRQAAKERPDRAILHDKLGRALVKSGNARDAMSAFVRATTTDPDYRPAYEALGEAFALLGDHTQAAKAYENLIRLDPLSARHHYSLAVSLEALQKGDQAASAYYRALELNPGLSDAYAPLIQLLRRQLTGQPGDPECLLRLGQTLEWKGDLGEARAQYSLATQHHPALRPAWESLRRVCAALADCQGELVALQALRQFAPRDLNLLDEALTVSRRCGMDEVRGELLQQRLELDPTGHQALVEMGRLHRQNGDRPAAYAYFRRYLAAEPSSPAVAELRSWCDREEAANPDLPRQYDAFELFLEGQAAFRDGRFAQALDRLESARRAWPAFAPLHFALGLVLEELDRRSEALYAYKEAIRLETGHAGYWFALGVALEAEGLLADAATCFQQVVQCDPDDRLGHREPARKRLISFRERGIIPPAPILD